MQSRRLVWRSAVMLMLVSCSWAARKLRISDRLDQLHAADNDSRQDFVLLPDAYQVDFQLGDEAASGTKRGKGLGNAGSA